VRPEHWMHVLTVVVDRASPTPILQWGTMPPHETVLQQVKPGVEVLVISLDMRTGGVVAVPAWDIVHEAAEADEAHRINDATFDDLVWQLAHAENDAATADQAKEADT
jgi:hypothetical protein